MTAVELWQGRASGSPLVLPADIDMDGPWSRASTLVLIDDWVVAGLLDRRHFLAVSGTTVLDIATRYLTGEPGRLAAALERGPVDNPLLAQIEQSIPLLQRLNDTHGGGAYLPYVGAQFRAVALLLRQGGHPARVERRLFAALAEIGQLAGWMALDAGRHGLAQRYLFTCLEMISSWLSSRLGAKETIPWLDFATFGVVSMPSRRTTITLRPTWMAASCHMMRGLHEHDEHASRLRPPRRSVACAYSDFAAPYWQRLHGEGN